MALQTDVPVLAKEAANFERIADELKTVLARVESTATEMDSHWQGIAAKAAQSAIQRFHEAASAQVQQLNEISTNIHTAGAQYRGTDDERAGAIAGAMAPAMGTAGAPAGTASAPAAQPNGQVHPAMATPVGNTGQFQYGGTTPGVWTHGNDAPNPVQLAGFEAKQDGPGPAPPPPPAPPVTGNPVRLPPRTTMNTAPPTAMNPTDHDPSKHPCGPDDVAIDITEAAGGAAGIASGIAGEVPTAAGSTAIVLGGMSALGDAVKKLSQCE
ncbi:WXG100 family type VII secretion target [Mycobacterium branderi]|uniref:WXG100 family type VII secretion target n=1 Tax=Mycobacterium branderi TaxID=43348 RepID=A0A7I7WBK4_9MYCO|nr:WXG100 family type VII secretion target [Mycobacterium branderi]MCV7232263.1 WXG100 family type VII secretion target [Mycobacterium branderi]ORA36153.1 hypothetical protein BST20_16495 [Mycobacterium branderi]BBZ14282.1 hypothetical protein MBRA_44770 [Mycobacterium branderi]